MTGHEVDEREVEVRRYSGTTYAPIPCSEGSNEISGQDGDDTDTL